MKEQEKPLERIETKMSELQSKILLYSSGVNESLNSITDQQVRKALEKTVHQAARLGEIINDTAWIKGLINTGMSAEIISKVWDAKDEENRKARIDSNLS